MGTASITEYNIKIRSLKNTCKITKTMKMVSASKLRKSHRAQASAKLYAQNLTALTSRVSAAVHTESHPLLTAREEVKRVLILIITSDKGLCGAFNHNANKRVACWIEDNRHHEQIDLYCCGKKGYAFFKKHDLVKKHYEQVTAEPDFNKAKEIGVELAREFKAGAYDEVYLSYNQFFNPLSQKTVFEKILPIDPQALIKKEVKGGVEYVFDPKAEELLEFLIPHFLYFKVYFALLENSAGEHGARMTAMDNATKNATDLIERYTLYRNRARQTAITTELSEIVAGAEAL